MGRENGTCLTAGHLPLATDVPLTVAKPFVVSFLPVAVQVGRFADANQRLWIQLVMRTAGHAQFVLGPAGLLGQHVVGHASQTLCLLFGNIILLLGLCGNALSF